MNKKLAAAVPAIFIALALGAQTYTGGVKGTVVNRTDKSVVSGADIRLYSGAEEVARLCSSGLVTDVSTSSGVAPG